MKALLIATLLAVAFHGVSAQTVKFKKHENVIYGMIGGMALLMDVYQPEKSNHRGIIFIPGSGWGVMEGYQRTYNQIPLKIDYTEDNYVAKLAPQLVDRGYTVFVIDHRFAPRYHYPEIFYDCQRAVKFIRYHAKKYDIDPKYIGAMGHSSGANLSSMLAVVDSTYPNTEKNSIDSLSGKVQGAVVLAAPFILSDINSKQDSLRDFVVKAVVNYVGEMPALKGGLGNFEFSGKYAEASPIYHVTKNDAPFLIYHSRDDVIPFRQATAMNEKLMAAGVPSKLVVSEKDGHFPKVDINEVDEWFKKYLK